METISSSQVFISRPAHMILRLLQSTTWCNGISVLFPGPFDDLHQYHHIVSRWLSCSIAYLPQPAREYSGSCERTAS